MTRNEALKTLKDFMDEIGDKLYIDGCIYSPFADAIEVAIDAIEKVLKLEDYIEDSIRCGGRLPYDLLEMEEEEDEE